MHDNIGNPIYVWNNEAKDIIFRNGYGKNAPEFTAQCTIYEGTGNPEWGAVEGKRYFVLKIIRIKERKYC